MDSLETLSEWERQKLLKKHRPPAPSAMSVRKMTRVQSGANQYISRKQYWMRIDTNESIDENAANMNI